MTKLFRNGLLALTFVGGLLFAAVYCSNPRLKPPELAISGPVRSPAEVLTESNLELFFKVIAAHPRHRVPEFQGGGKTPTAEASLPAEAMAKQLKAGFREQFDSRRQAALWSQDSRWTKAFASQQTTANDFAALVSIVSCAVMREQIDQLLQDPHELEAQASKEIEEYVAQIKALDGKTDRASVRQRTAASIQLSHATALQVFAEMLAAVPEGNIALVRKYKDRLTPLLPGDFADRAAKFMAP